MQRDVACNSAALDSSIGIVQARETGLRLAALLNGSAERIMIGGSIRRGKPRVSDIEILAVPKIGEGPSPDLFGESSPIPLNLFDLRCEELRSEGILGNRLDKNGRPAWGARFKRAVFEGVAVDIFCVLPPAQWGAIAVIRTGPSEFSQWLVTNVRHGGCMPDGCYQKDGALHRYGRLIETPEEVDYFRELGLMFIPPEERVAPSTPFARRALLDRWQLVDMEVTNAASPSLM